MVYANVSTLNEKLYADQIYNTNYIWVARYNNRVSAGKWVYSGKYSIWQYSESLSINGINGNSVDGDFWYDDGLSMALNRKGLFYQGNDLYYFKNGFIDKTFNGVAKCIDKWYYVKNGKADLLYTGLAKNSNGWWYCHNGMVDFKANSVYKNSSGWWYVKDGNVDFGYNGIANTSEADLYVVDGKVDFSYTGEFEQDGQKYKIVNGKVN